MPGIAGLKPPIRVVGNPVRSGKNQQILRTSRGALAVWVWPVTGNQYERIIQ
jgi:hypothetical protein